MIMKQRFIKINISLAGYEQGQQWPYKEAPEAIRFWLEKKSILVETRICSLVEIDNIEVEKKEEENVEPKNKTAAQINQDKINKLLGDEADEAKEPEKAKKKPKVIKPKKPKATKKGKSKKKTGRPKGSKNKKK